MGNFQGGGNRGGGFRGGNGGGGGRPNFRGGDRGPVTMHKAVCDECQKECQVPFRPSGDKPVYCNDCFSSKKGDDRGPRKDFGGDRGPRRDFNDRGTPAPFAKAPAPANDDMKNQFREINAKLDRLVNAIEKLSQTSASKAEVKSVPVIKAVAKKAITKKVVAKKKK